MSLLSPPTPASSDTAAPASPASAAPVAPEGQGQSNPSHPPAPTTSEWLNTLPEALRGQASLAVFPSVEKLAKGYVDLKTHLGKKLEPPTMPGEGAPPEAVAAWRKITGAPESPDGYGELRPEDFPKELWGDLSNAEPAIKGVLHKHHASPAMVKELMSTYAEVIKGEATAFKQRQDAELAASAASLKQAWGADHDRRLQVLSQNLKEGGFDINHPAFADATFVQTFYRFLQANSSKRIELGGSGPPPTAVRMREFSNPQTTDYTAQAYQGKHGRDAQLEAQKAYRDLINASAPS